jgi:hypothetical protein
VLDHVERRRFLVQPAREDRAPAAAGALDEDLDEGAGELLLFPRRGRLARPELDDDVPPARGLARPKRDVAHDPVALVEDAQHRNALCHRSDTAYGRTGRAGLVRSRLVLLLFGALAAGGKRKRQDDCG